MILFAGKILIFMSFCDETQKNAETVISASLPSTSDKDPVSTSLVKQCKDILVKPLTDGVSISLRSRVVIKYVI